MDFVIAVSRYLLPCITIIILSKCVLTLLLGRAKDTTYAYIIDTSTNARYALNTWETSLGKSASCDIVLPYEDLAKFQVSICRRNDSWYIYDLMSKTKTKVNSTILKNKAEIANFDTISFAGHSFSFRVVADPVQNKNEQDQPVNRKAAPQKATPQNDDSSLPLNNKTTIPKHKKPALISAATRRIYIIEKNPTKIGRAVNCDIKPLSNSAAQIHATLILYNEGWGINKIGKNSCYLNSSLITQPQLLYENDIIKIAGEVFYFTYNYGSSR